jgi:ribosomal protein L30E
MVYIHTHTQKHTMEYYSAINKMKLMSFTGKRMEL